MTNIHTIPRQYYGTIKAELLYGISGQAEVPSMTYTINDAWPSSVGALDLSHEDKEIAQFPVTFTYN
ncbi:MAG: hypothetical protein ACOCVF_03810 [bacterium]